MQSILQCTTPLPFVVHVEATNMGRRGCARVKLEDSVRRKLVFAGCFAKRLEEIRSCLRLKPDVIGLRRRVVCLEVFPVRMQKFFPISLSLGLVGVGLFASAGLTAPPHNRAFHRRNTVSEEGHFSPVMAKVT